MPGVLQSLFSKPDNAPDMPLLNIPGVLAQGQAYNQTALQNFQNTAPGQATFMQGLYNQLSPQVQQAQNTNFSLGQQLAQNGYSSAQSNALNYYRTVGLETAAATGAPVSSQYAQNYGGGLGIQQILQNQEAGAGLLGQTSQFQNTLSNQDLAPSMQALQTNMVNPTQLFQPAEYNNSLQGQNAQINFANSQNTSWFNSLLTKTLGSVVSTPFDFVQSGDSVVANSPQLFASMFAGSGAMQGQNLGSLGSTGNPSMGGGNNGSAGGGGGGILSGLMGGGGGAGAGAACCFIMMEAYNGKMPSWVRVCRDEFAPENTARRIGYVKMARWLIPAMRASKIARSLVWHLMVSPLTKWGGFYKKVPGFEKYGYLRPIVKMWFGVWERMGS